MEYLQPSDGVLHRDSGSRMAAVVFYLRGDQFWAGVLGFAAIVPLCPLEAKVEPQIHFVEPFGIEVEYLFHQGVVVDAAGEDTEKEKDLAWRCRVVRVSDWSVWRFFFRCSGLSWSSMSLRPQVHSSR